MSTKNTSDIIREAGVIVAVDRAGGYRALAKVLGIQPTAVWRWERVPAERCVQIEREVGVPRETLRPDLFERAK
jgi:DNA-binding transcriptional regulator YdaS (Cro superfamily)